MKVQVFTQSCMSIQADVSSGLDENPQIKIQHITQSSGDAGSVTISIFYELQE